MKIRNGFVSNSSSSAFIIKMKDLTMEQLEKIVQSFQIELVNGEVRSKYVMDRDEVKHILDSLEVSRDVIKWTYLE